MLKQAQVQGLDNVIKRLEKLKQSSINDGDLDIVVGYAASHATYVHEINKNYNYGKQWKYLETPFKMLQGYFAKVIIQSYTRTGSIRVGLKKSAKALYAESQALVPIDTGELKASGFIAWDYEVQSKAEAAYRKGQAKKAATQKRRARQRTRERNQRRRSQ